MEQPGVIRSADRSGVFCVYVVSTTCGSGWFNVANKHHRKTTNVDLTNGAENTGFKKLPVFELGLSDPHHALDQLNPRSKLR